VPCRRLPVLVLLLTLAVPALARSQSEPAATLPPSSPAPQSAPFALQYSETELAEIVRAVAEHTGISFLFDDRLRGRVTITAPRPVRGDEAVELLAAALRMTGFAVLRAASGPYEIVPVSDTAGRVELSPSTPRAFVDLPVTTLVPLHTAQAEALLPIVQALLGSNAVVQAFAPTNVLILSATEAQLHRAILLLRALDRAQARQLLVLRPHFRDATELLPLVQATFPESRRASESLRIFADASSNALLIEGPVELVKEVRDFVRTLDLPAAGQGRIHVVRILHADVEELAEVVQQAAQPASGVGQAQNAPPGAEAASDALTGHDFALSADKPTNSLLIRSDGETFRLLGQLIAALDVDVPSVSVKTTLIEVEDTDSLDVAIDTILPFTRAALPNEGTGFVRLLNSGVPSLLGSQPQDSSEPFRLRFFKDPVTFTRVDASGKTVTEVVPSYGVNVRAQATQGNTRLVSEPQILARSGEEQELFVGNNIPIISATQTSAAGATPTVSNADPLQISQNIERQDVGVRLRVKPTVPEEGPVRLEIRLEFSALAAPFAGDVNQVGPTLIKQSVESTIYLDDGAGAVIGVRGEPMQESLRTGTPWLKDVPGLGWLFSSVSNRTVRKDLVLAVQVKVIRSAEDLELESIRRRVALERSVAGLESLPVSPEEAPFAVWVATTQSREAADSLVAGLDLGNRRAEVVAWKPGEPQRFDVYVLGFDRYAEAMKTSLEVRSQGFEPEVVALPGRPL